jgi:hypothetical protein
VILQRASYTRKIDQLIIDCKDGKIILQDLYIKKILLDKISIPGIKTYEVYQNGGYASVEKL